MTAHLPHFSQRLIPLKMFIDMGKTAAFVPTRCEWEKNRLKWINETTILTFWLRPFFVFMCFAICACVWLCEWVRRLNEIAPRNDNNNSNRKAASSSAIKTKTSSTTKQRIKQSFKWLDASHHTKFSFTCLCVIRLWLANCDTHFNFAH